MKKFLIIGLIILTVICAFCSCSESPNTDASSDDDFEEIIIDEIVIEEIIIEEIIIEETTIEEEVSSELGNAEEIDEFELVRQELKAAQKRCDYDKVQECMNKIIDMQNGNFCEVTTIIAFGSVSHCTTSYDVNDKHWSAKQISSKAFGKNFLYANIENGNVCHAIEKATGWDYEFLKDKLVTIALNEETNGYEFFLEEIIL